MEAQAADDNSSGKLAGADNDMHHKKSAGADKDIEKREWTPDRSVEVAQKYVGSTDWSLEADKDNFSSGDYKCNKFVYDILTQSGAKVPLMNEGRNPFNEGGFPPAANDWADKKKEIDGWVVIDKPKPGDVASYHGHVGVVSGDSTTVSASSDADKVVENDWGFRSTQKGKVTFRRYVGRTVNK